MERHTENALKVAQYLEKHPKVAWVRYAGLPTSEYYALAQKYMKGRPSALLAFGIKGGFDSGVKFYDALKLFKRLVYVSALNISMIFWLISIKLCRQQHNTSKFTRNFMISSGRGLIMSASTCKIWQIFNARDFS